MRYPEETGQTCRELESFSLSDIDQIHSLLLSRHRLSDSLSITMASSSSSVSSPSTWTIIHNEDSFDHASDIQALRTVLEKGNDDAKIHTMQKILVIMLNGDSLPGLLMHIIRFVYS